MHAWNWCGKRSTARDKKMAGRRWVVPPADQAGPRRARTQDGVTSGAKPARPVVMTVLDTGSVLLIGKAYTDKAGLG